MYFNFSFIDYVICFHYSAPSFHIPSNESTPLILIGPGTGIAPFRGFWCHRQYQIKNKMLRNKPGPIWLFFGCRSKCFDLYKNEKDQMVKEGVLTKNFLALSREQGIPKVNKKCTKNPLQIIFHNLR